MKEDAILDTCEEPNQSYYNATIPGHQ